MGRFSRKRSPEVAGKEERNENEGNKEEENEEDETVSNNDMEHSVIVIAPGRPRRSRS
jgi:hypothetical protein